ncbi:hypothetical protein ACQP2T_56500 [Nonomuraea sp. CA-143628]|uniref:hypothetical protein n=1 Tax=Nonomuraea sp. CA-143628 TaxID=3239997 RepID=UPI003D8DFBC6
MNEKDLRALLVKATEDRPAGIDLMPTAPKMAGMPKRRPFRVLVPIAGVGIATAVSAIVLGLPTNQPSAQAQVAAAVENTSQESYRIHSTSGLKTFDGAFDPVQRVGVITRAGDEAETRFVGDLMYVREHRGAKWMVSPRVEPELRRAPAVVALVKLAPLDPQEALQRLRSATDVRENGSVSGQGWTGQRFTYSLKDTGGFDPKGDAVKPQEVTGAVNVDDQGRVRRLEVVFSDTGQRNVTDFGDFGTPVTVTAPPADRVEQLPTDQSDKGVKDGKGVKPSEEPSVKNS